MDDWMDGLARNLSTNIAALRRSRRLSQSGLAKASGLPRSTITLLESGSANPSVQNLVRVASVLQVRVEELLARPRPACQLIRAADVALHRRSREGVTLRKLLPDPLPGTEIDELILEPGKQLVGVPHTQGTKEYLTCVQGEMSVEVTGENFVVREGDVLAFAGDQSHAYRNRAARRCRALSVVVIAPGA